MATINQNITAIREAKLGRQVREAIAESIEQTYGGANSATVAANAAASAAINATTNAISAGAAAEAATAAAQALISNLNDVEFDTGWERGGINNTYGTLDAEGSATEDTRIRTSDFIQIDHIWEITWDETVEVSLKLYSQPIQPTSQNNQYYVKGINWRKSNNPYTFANLTALKTDPTTSDAKYLKVVACYTPNNSSESISEIADVSALVHIIQNHSIGHTIDLVDNLESSLAGTITNGLNDNAINSTVDLQKAVSEGVPGIVFESGTISSITGLSAAANNRIYCTRFIAIEDIDAIYTDSLSRVALRFYTSADKTTYTTYTDFLYGTINVQSFAPEGSLYVRVVAAYGDNRVIEDPSDLSRRLHIKKAGTSLDTNRISSELDYLEQSSYYLYFDPKGYTYGGIQGGSSGGVENSQKTRAKSIMPIYINPISKITSISEKEDSESSDNRYKIALRLYNNGTYIGSYPSNWTQSIDVSEVRRLYPEATEFRIIVANRDDDTSNIFDINSLPTKIRMYARYRMIDIPLELVYGVYSSVNYTIINPTDPPNTRLSHNKPVTLSNMIRITVPNGYYVTYRMLDAKKDAIGYSNWLSGNIVLSKDDHPEVEYLLLAFKKSGDAEITGEDFKKISTQTRLCSIGKQENYPYKVELTTPITIQSITDNEINAPVLCSVKFKYESNRRPVPIGYLFRDVDEPFNFYWSSDGKTIKQIFQWNKSVTDTGSRTPYEYSIGISYEGDVICVYRGELAYFKYQHDEELMRQNPIVYPHGDYEHPVQVDFGDDPPPTSWLQNTGYHAESSFFYMCEYTRFAHKKSYVWRVAAPYTSKANWGKIKEFDVSGKQYGFKHCHNIERDPYTGVLWLTTGDVPLGNVELDEGRITSNAPGIYYSTDNGSTWNVLIENSQLICRQLNFIWTEDYVYWASDTSSYAEHYFMRCCRDANGIIDIENLEYLAHLNSAATYNLCYSESPKGILILNRHDSKVTSGLDIFFWDILREKLYVIDRIEAIGSGDTGFRVEAISHYPGVNGSAYLCGFSLTGNNFDLPGNKYNSNSTYGDADYVKNDAHNAGKLNNLQIKIATKGIVD